MTMTTRTTMTITRSASAAIQRAEMTMMTTTMTRRSAGILRAETKTTMMTTTEEHVPLRMLANFRGRSCLHDGKWVSGNMTGSSAN